MARLLSLFVIIATWTGFAQAQVSEPVVTGHAETRLVAEYDAAKPGETITLALMQTLEDHWHVYWQNPGDSGLPLNLAWDLPDGFEAGAIQYPLPHRLPLGPLVNYGHEGSPVFLIDITVPETATPGTVAGIAVDAEWLICADICVPEQARLALELPIAESRGEPTGGYAIEIGRVRRALPREPVFETVYFDHPRGPVLRIAGGPEGEYDFFPYTPAATEPSAEVVKIAEDGVVLLGLKSGFAYQAKAPETLAGVLVVETPTRRRGYEIFAPKVEPREPLPAALTPDSAGGGGGEAPGGASTEASGGNAPSEGALPQASDGAPLFGVTLLFAFLGGVILNVMPCVFPIVFLKAAGFAAVAKEHRSVVRLHGVLYTVGVLAAFAGLAILLLVLRQGGEQLGWGFHLQSPIAIAVFAGVLFLVGLNLFGMFEVGSSVQGLGDNLAKSGGAAGAFFTGLLAVAVAAPCIGPMLGGAVGLALSRSAVEGVLIFLMIGLGLAFPYLLLSLVPTAARLLPRPGPWMVTLRQLFAFAMFATVIWLVWVLSIQAGPPGVLRLGLGLLALSFGAWLFGRAQRGQSGIMGRIVALAAVGLAIWPLSQITTAESSGASFKSLGEVETAEWSPAALEALREEGRPVFVDFTAAWCITCQVNKRTVLDTARVREAFAANDVVYMVADWTNRDDDITAALEELGRAGVPVYLYYAPGAESPVMLPQLLTVPGVLSVFVDD